LSSFGLFPSRGQSAEAPGLLGLATVLQFVEPAYQPIGPLWPIDLTHNFGGATDLPQRNMGLIGAARPLPSSDPPESATCVGPIG
jgi:hypothetical protein